MSDVILYTKNNCQPCRLTKRLLEAKGITYETRDLDTDDEAVEAVLAMGHQSAPVVVIVGRHSWSGFRPDLINEIGNWSLPDERE